MKYVRILCLVCVVLFIDESFSSDIITDLGRSLNNVTGSVSESILFGNGENNKYQHDPYASRVSEKTYNHQIYEPQQVRRNEYDQYPKSEINQNHRFQEISGRNYTYVLETSTRRGNMSATRAPVPVGDEDGKAIIDAPEKSCGEGSRRDFRGECRKIFT